MSIHSEGIAPTDDERCHIDWALSYAQRYWQHGGEPESQRALSVLASVVRRSEVPEPSAEPVEKAVRLALARHGHRFSLNAADERDLGSIILSTIGSTSEQGEPSDAQAERARIIADLREWSRPLGTSPEEETLRLVIERIECAAGGVR